MLPRKELSKMTSECGLKSLEQFPHKLIIAFSQYSVILIGGKLIKCTGFARILPSLSERCILLLANVEVTLCGSVKD